MYENVKVALIAALANNNAIGNKGQLLIHLPADLKWFKQNTLDKTIIMGRKTFETLPNGALAKRRNIVLTKKADYNAKNIEIAHNLEELKTLIEKEEKVFVIGGAEIYKEFLPLADELIITRIYGDFEADRYFPKIDFSQWQEKQRIENKADNKNLIDFDFIIYEKK